MAEKWKIRPVRLGMKVYGRCAPGRGTRYWYGKVIYMDPKGWFCIVAFDAEGREIHESYHLDVDGCGYVPVGDKENLYLKVLEEE